MRRILAGFALPFFALAFWIAPAAPSFAALDIQKVTSPKGVVAWLVQDHKVPLIAMSFAFRSGAVYDPPGKAGLASMVSSLLDEGAGKLDSEEFHRRLEELAGSVSFSASRDYFQGSMRTLSKYRDQMFDLLRLSVTAPRFDPEPVERIRAQTIAVLRDEANDPGTIAAHTWFATMFPDHPYGHRVIGTFESVKAIQVDDLRRFVHDHLTRDTLEIGVVGDIAPEELARRLDEVFAGLPAAAAGPKIAQAHPSTAGRTIVVQQAVPQSVVMFGEPGIARHDPDWYAAYVMNRILGGSGLTSRLSDAIREKRGLVYSVYSYLNPMEHAALIEGRLATANESVAEALDLLRAQWGKMAKEGVTEDEISAAKTYLNGAFPLRFNSSGAIADTLVAIQLERLGIDYVKRRAGLIDAVTLADVKRVAARLLHPDQLTVVVVGQPKGVVSSAPGGGSEPHPAVPSSGPKPAPARSGR